MLCDRRVYRAPHQLAMVVVVLALTALLCAAQLASGKGIHVTVEASWNETSFLQEGCEWAGRSFGCSAFYRCVNALWDPKSSHASTQGIQSDTLAELKHQGIHARLSSQRMQYAAAEEVARIVAKTQMTDTALFGLEMASRVYSPAVEAHYKFAEQALSEVADLSSADGDALCACGEPFGVLYSRALSTDGQVRAHHVCTAAALEMFRTLLQRRQREAGPATPSSSMKHAVLPVLSASEVTLAGLDYRYPFSHSAGPNTAAVFVLYGLLGSPETQLLHDAAVEWGEMTAPTQDAPERAVTSDESGDDVAAPTLAYFFRHLPVSRARLCGPLLQENGTASLSEQWDSPLAVQGYGVTVDIKNMEYKVLDEKAAAQQRAKEEEAGMEGSGGSANAQDGRASLVGQADHVVGGLHFQRLTERYPQLSTALTELATLLGDEVGSGDSKVDFDVWELQNIGLAATQYIREVDNSSRRLHVLKDVVNRFPLYAAALSRIASQPARFEAVQKTIADARLRLPPGTSALYVDGWRVEEKDLSLFGALDALRADEVVSLHVKRALTTRVRRRHEEASARAVETVSVAPDVMQKVTSYVKRAALRARDASGAVLKDNDVAFALPEAYITWVNDVETDPRFDRMSPRLSSILAQSPGGTSFPRRNLLNFVFIWNPLLKSHLQMLMMIYRFNRQGLPARYGLLFLDPVWSPKVAQETAGKEGTAGGFDGQSALSEDVFAVSAVAYHLAAAGKPELLLEVLVQLLQSSGSASDAVPSGVVMKVCRRTAKSVLGASLEELMYRVDFLDYYHETQEMIRRFPFTTYPAALLNGVVRDLASGQLATALEREMDQLREWVVGNALQDHVADLYTQMLQLRGAADHLQPALLRAPQSMRWTATQALVAFVEDAAYLYSAGYAMDVPALTQILALPCRITSETLRQLQTVLAALEACASVKEERTTQYAVCRRLRVTVATCPAGPTTASSQITAADVPGYIAALLRDMDRRGVAEETRFSTVHHYVSHVLAAVSPGSSTVLDQATVGAALARHALPTDLQLKTHSAVTEGQLRGEADFWTTLASAVVVSECDITLVTNGRIVAMDNSFSTGDVLEAARQVLPTTKSVEEALLKVNFAEMSAASGAASGFTAEEMDNAFYSGKIACLTSVFEREKITHEVDKVAALPAREDALFAKAEDRRRLQAVSFTVNNTATPAIDAAAAREGGSVHQVTAVVDPSSRDAQLIVSLISHLMQTPLRLRLTVVLNPSLEVKFPIRDFYEYVAAATVRFDETTGSVVAPAATFAQLPATALLTLGVEEPPTWTVFSQEAEEDLDNILLSKLSPGTPFVFAVYRLHSILVTGDATDALAGGPPDGLPLSLTPAQPRSALGSSRTTAASSTHSTDTQVMANQNGYYQLQAAPGLWLLSVKPGPVAAAYCIEAIGSRRISECADGRSNVTFAHGQRIPVVIDSFSGRYLSLRVRHTPSPSLSADVQSSSISSSGREHLHDILQKMAVDVKHAWPPPWKSRGDRPQTPEKPTLNIFSVASGHLYERFLRMMFYSVHTTSSDKYGANTTRIKFWVIENFLSPQFKQYIPLLAAELGFEVGFVTYRWPWWLPRQTEKQRKIWAYKILFLDVIFPLDVDRVIFVDADQTAQADLHELYHMDIGRHPVAMTPFCQKNRNKDTVRFRFWEHGFWVNHLRGKPYHISAIFLVDLRQFRAMLAGDRYRSTYAMLAGDPNSLSNLDQDLPNYLQAEIPIFSLPEQWLWCETWCSANSKSKAKTIDLCNNPLTKMPKLDNAKMVIPNWEDLDNKLQNLSDNLLTQH